MRLNSFLTAPARLGLGLGRRVAGTIQSRLGSHPTIDDETIKKRVEADIRSSRLAAHTKLAIEVVEGVVWLRGEVEPGPAEEEIVSRASAIDGVKRVENLLRPTSAKPKPNAPKRPAKRRSPRQKPAAASAPPPEAKPAEPTPPPAAQEERSATAPRRFTAQGSPGEAETSPTGEGESPPAPFPSGVANGTGADDDSAS